MPVEIDLWALGALTLWVVVWPWIHGALLVEGVLALQEPLPRFSRVALTVILTPLFMLLVQAGAGCLGGCAVPALGGGFLWILGLGAGLVARTMAYAGLLRLPTSKAMGLAVANSLVAWVASGLLTLLVALLQKLL